MIHREDLAALYRAAAESSLAGEVFNAVDGAHATVWQCAEAASTAVTGTAKVVSTPVEEGRRVMGPMADCLVLNQRLDASKAVQMLGWRPRHPSFTAGAARHYRAWKAAGRTTS